MSSVPIEEAVPQSADWFKEASGAFAQFDKPDWMEWGPRWLLPHLYQAEGRRRIEDRRKETRAKCDAYVRALLKENREGKITMDEVKERSEVINKQYEEEMRRLDGEVGGDEERVEGGYEERAEGGVGNESESDEDEEDNEEDEKEVGEVESKNGGVLSGPVRYFRLYLNFPLIFLLVSPMQEGEKGMHRQSRSESMCEVSDREEEVFVGR
jgi:hypothetical protein